MAALHCATCEVAVHLRQCGRCGQAHYCSGQCQRRDWESFHRYVCASLAAFPFSEGEFHEYEGDWEQLDEELFCNDASILEEEEEEGSAHTLGAARRFRAPSRSRISRGKACKILHEGRVRGRKLTGRQRRYMGWVCGGRKRPRRRRHR